MRNWTPIPKCHSYFGPAIVGWSGSPQVMRAFHDGVEWFAIIPRKDGSVREGGSCVRLTESPTHYLPILLMQEIWGPPSEASGIEAALRALVNNPKK
jgi:hypothetical protein